MCIVSKNTDLPKCENTIAYYNNHRIYELFFFSFLVKIFAYVLK